ncbi:hypothetical protein FRC04_000318 [Tulasnella sp. 424]|nr:hypothetical protein FRC04_000318 [Tulasnella sp. 424]
MSNPSVSNAAFLGQQAAARAAKKKAKQARQGEVQEILFDDRARRQFLTGFHRRKLEREAVYKRRAKERERQEKIADRAEASGPPIPGADLISMIAQKKKEMLERAKRNRIDVERALGNDEIGEDYDPLSDVVRANNKGKGRQAEQEVEFETEDVTATVTVVEEFDVDELITGKPRLQPDLTEEGDDEGSDTSRSRSPSEEPAARRPQPSVLEMAAPPVRKKKQADYETLHEKQDRIVSEKKKRLRASLEARERAKVKPKKRRKDDHGRKRPHR